MWTRTVVNGKLSCSRMRVPRHSTQQRLGNLPKADLKELERLFSSVLFSTIHRPPWSLWTATLRRAADVPFLASLQELQLFSMGNKLVGCCVSSESDEGGDFGDTLSKPVFYEDLLNSRLDNTSSQALRGSQFSCCKAKGHLLNSIEDDAGLEQALPRLDGGVAAMVGKKATKKGKVKPKAPKAQKAAGDGEAPKKRKAPKAKVTEVSEPKVEQEEVATQEKAKPRKTKANRFKDAMEAEEEPKEGESSEPKGVVYLGHIPDGFFEQQIKKYFSQFGDVTRFKLARSRKTGGSKGYAFIEYILGNKTLVCTFKPREECHPKLFSGWREEISDPRPAKRAKHMLGFNDRPTVEVDGQAVPQMTEEQVKRRDSQKKKVKAKLKQLEVDYDIDDVLGGAADDEAEEEDR
eukprot:s1141_g17.t2